MSLILRLKAIHKDNRYFAVLLTVSIHFLLLVLLQNKSLPISKHSAEIKAKEAIVFLAITTPVEVPKPKQKPFLEAKHKVFQAANLATVPVLNQTQKNTALQHQACQLKLSMNWLHKQHPLHQQQMNGLLLHAIPCTIAKLIATTGGNKLEV